MRNYRPLIYFLLRSGALLAMCQPAPAQHCAPVYESYLNEISLKGDDGNLQLQMQYTLEGGAGQDVFQAYLIAYLERDADLVPVRGDGDTLDPKVLLVLDTQLVKRNEEGVFPLSFSIDGSQLAQDIINHRDLTEQDYLVIGGWAAYRDRLRLAVFIPTLEDHKYSVLEGLPEDRHCCTTTDVAALLWQTLPYRLSFRTKEDKPQDAETKDFLIAINGDRTPLSDWPPAHDSPLEGSESSDVTPLDFPEFHARGDFTPTAWHTPLQDVYAMKPFKGSYDNSLSWKLLESNPSDCVADIGCGYGGQVRSFRKTLGPHGKVLGRDISQKAIDRATRTEVPDGCFFELSLLDDVRIEPETLDGAYMSQVWGYLDNQKETRIDMLQSLLRALKPGGELILVHYPSRNSYDGEKIVNSLDSMMREAGFAAGRRWQFHDPEGRDGLSWAFEYRRPEVGNP